MPNLEGKDLIGFVVALEKKDSEKARNKRKEAKKMLDKVLKESMEFKIRSWERDDDWTLNEEQIQQILNTPPTKIKESEVFNDIHLNEEERIEHARKILESRVNN